MTALRLAWRLVMAVFAYCVAAVAAGLFLLLAMGITAPQDFIGGPAPYQLEAWILVLAAAAVVSVIGFAPAIIAILIAEIFAVRSWIYCTLVGVAVAAFVDTTGPYFAYAADPQTGSDLVLMSACGAVGGLVYWLIAGRNAGVDEPEPK